MRVRNLKAAGFKRFTDLTISGLPATARLVVMTGPNGCGKSSLLDAFRVWQMHHWERGINWDDVYYRKKGSEIRNHSEHIQIEFHQPLPQDPKLNNKIFYLRSAYRNEPDFTTQQLIRMGSVFEENYGQKRMIDNETSVSHNYQRLVSLSIAGLYGGQYDGETVKALREKFIGEIRSSMKHVFEDLVLNGPGDPLEQGSFFFEKGASKDFHYKNLSAGEKAAFDILLDVLVKRQAYDDTVFCIDEPEMHMHTKLQARLLKELLSLVPETSQLWIATHSIGMMRAARDLFEAAPAEVVFLDFHEQNFDAPVTLLPKKVDRQFWANTLSVALDDLAQLVAPKQVVLCEGKPTGNKEKPKAEFDAQCYRAIFADELADTDFASVGNAADVQSDRIQLGRTIETLISGTKVIRLIDRDDRSEQEIADAAQAGVRVLSRRHIEAYLVDDEVLRSLCLAYNQPEKDAEVLAAKSQAVSESVQRGNAPDDFKSAAGKLFTSVVEILSLKGKQCGSTTEAFLRDTLAPLLKPELATYQQLKKDIFGG
jgi:predicted ATPase